LFETLKDPQERLHLSTLGDAIASYLARPDPSLNGVDEPRSLRTQKDRLSRLRKIAPWVHRYRQTKRSRAPYWYQTVSRRRLISTVGL